jgi:hypothetical protein
MTSGRVVLPSLGLLIMTGLLHAQVATTKTTEAAGAAKVTTSQITGEVVGIEGNRLLARLQPSGVYQFFNVQPGREFIIDGQKKLIGDIKPGTVLTATVTTTDQPLTTRTTTVTNGTVWWVQGNYVVLTFPDGENKAYTVPESYRFVVDGKPATVADLKKGMRVSGTKIVSEPQRDISTTTTVTGKAPK